MSLESCSPLGSDSLELSCSALSGDEQFSVEDNDSCSSSINSNSPMSEKVPCQICRLQNSAVIYFNVPVCSGCRAFFRRSVKKGKSYQCLNSRLCGKNLLVPNRRVCKYCRFDRCVKAGMLDAKLRLQNRLGNCSTVETQFLKSPTFSSSSVDDQKTTPNVLSQFQQLKQAIRDQRSRLYNVPLEPRQSLNGVHDLAVNLNEHVLFNQTVAATKNLFSPIDLEDWNTLTIFEYSMWWSLVEQAQLTVRNYGHELQRSYNLDLSYSQLGIDEAHKHWQCVNLMIDAENRSYIYDPLVEYLNGVQLSMTNSIGCSLAKAQLDEVELSALSLLLMTRPACLDIVKNEKTKEYLKSLRDQTLSALADYLKQNDRNVDERMGQIIFLISDFQNLGRLVKHSVRLLMTATSFRAAPKEFLAFFEQQLQLYEKYAVF